MDRTGRRAKGCVPWTFLDLTLQQKRHNWVSVTAKGIHYGDDCLANKGRFQAIACLTLSVCSDTQALVGPKSQKMRHRDNVQE
jgi:hypothetical protein